mmetsp:Transcript_81050/g.229507  ORF Transcript_81050/g.229507 Transcript_81050/m.229507 type:complete len:225 (-) Transcript_81050:109-783(-)
MVQHQMAAPLLPRDKLWGMRRRPRRLRQAVLTPLVLLAARAAVSAGPDPVRSAGFLGASAGRSHRQPQGCGRRAARSGSGTSQTVLDALKEFDGDFRAPFELLDIEDPEVPKPDIRAAFRRIARVEHPDVSDRPDAEDRFRRISMAYELLMDDGGRAMLMEAMERDVEDLEELETTANELDEQNQAWDERWVEDEFTAVSRTIFLIFFSIGLGAVLWWFGFEHE